MSSCLSPPFRYAPEQWSARTLRCRNGLLGTPTASNIPVDVSGTATAQPASLHCRRRHATDSAPVARRRSKSAGCRLRAIIDAAWPAATHGTWGTRRLLTCRFEPQPVYHQTAQLSTAISRRLQTSRHWSWQQRRPRRSRVPARADPLLPVDADAAIRTIEHTRWRLVSTWVPEETRGYRRLGRSELRCGPDQAVYHHARKDQGKIEARQLEHEPGVALGGF